MYKFNTIEINEGSIKKVTIIPQLLLMIYLDEGAWIILLLEPTLH